MTTPSNAWPKQMEISVSVRPHRLLELLWVREAYGLHPTSDVPLLVDPPDRLDVTVDTDAWSATWDTFWAASLHREAVGVPEGFSERLSQTALSSRARSELIGSLRGPSWSETFGEHTLGEACFDWCRRQTSESPDLLQPLEETPERISTEALTHAWEKGFTKIVTIPCRGTFFQKVDTNALLVTDETRNDADLLSTVLNNF